MQGPERVRPEQSSKEHFYGVCFLEEVPISFTALLWQEDSSWRGRLETWGHESFYPKTGNLTSLLNIVNDQEQRKLQFTMYHEPTRRELRFELEKPVLSGKWIGACAYLKQPGQRYLVQGMMMTVPGNMFNRAQLLEELEALEQRKQLLAKHRSAATTETASPIIRGSYALMPKQAPESLFSTFGSAEVETSARYVIAFCRQRSSEGGSGSWDPFSREDYEAFCLAQGFRRGHAGDWFEGLIVPVPDWFSPHGGGYLVVQPDGLIGVTERFVQCLIRKAKGTL